MPYTRSHSDEHSYAGEKGSNMNGIFYEQESFMIYGTFNVETSPNKDYLLVQFCHFEDNYYNLCVYEIATGQWREIYSWYGGEYVGSRINLTWIDQYKFLFNMLEIPNDTSYKSLLFSDANFDDFVNVYSVDIQNEKLAKALSYTWAEQGLWANRYHKQVYSLICYPDDVINIYNTDYTELLYQLNIPSGGNITVTGKSTIPNYVLFQDGVLRSEFILFDLIEMKKVSFTLEDVYGDIIAIDEGPSLVGQVSGTRYDIIY